MQAKALRPISRGCSRSRSARPGSKAERVETYATPRRLALIARGLPDATEAVSEEIKGPRTSAPDAGARGLPAQDRPDASEQLVERDGILFATIDTARPRRPPSVLAEAIPAIVRAFPWPKSMRWGEASTSTESLRWVRPLQGIVALLGDEIVDVRDRRHHIGRGDGRPPLPPSRRRSRSAARRIMSRSCAPATSSSIRRSARRSSARARRSSQRNTKTDPRRRAGRRKCRAHRMAGAAEGQLRRSLSRRCRPR